MTKYNGGWHRQSTRHSNARKYGKAGGNYASDNYRLQYFELREKRNNEKQAKLTSYGLKNPIRNKIKGGLADGINTKQLPQKQLQKGIKVELEHTNNPIIAKEIATDHIVENPKYYDELEKMEGKIKPIKIKITHKELRREKNKLEIDLLEAIKNVDNKKEKKQLMHYYRELRKADSHTKIQRFIKEYGNAITTMGIAIPLQLMFPLVMAGVILSGGLTQETAPLPALLQTGMPLAGTLISGEAIRHSIKTIKAIKARQKEIVAEKTKELKQNTKIPDKEIKIIATRIAQRELSQTKIVHELI